MELWGVGRMGGEAIEVPVLDEGSGADQSAAELLCRSMKKFERRTEEEDEKRN